MKNKLLTNLRNRMNIGSKPARSNRTNKMIVGALTSIASGAILGMLFAPDKGRATRKKITRKSNQLFDEVKKDLNGVRNYVSKQAEQAKEGIMSKGEDLAQQAKAYEEWTKEELYETAKKSKIDGYSQMNKDELVDALKKNLLGS